MPEQKLIGPAEVVRDGGGWWDHPDIPDFNEDIDAFKAWLADQGLKVIGWHMDSDIEAHPYFDDGAYHCLGWEPETPPGGEWFLMGIFDTDDGPYVQWARRVTP
ncbi:hypothetical protein [Pseudomonas putida]